MLGRNLASLERPSRRLMQRLWGIPDIHTRQKWKAIWPFLKNLSRLEKVVLLDAGCGSGRWSLELAARRPQWAITGIDADETCIEIARHSQRRLELNNVRFEEADFFNYHEHLRYDAVLSVCSAHTSAEAGKGGQLFRQFERWLKPGGRLFLLVPRRFSETPFTSWLARQHWQQVFARGELIDLCGKNQFIIEHLSGRIGKLGTFAKQIDVCFMKRLRRSSRILAFFLYSFVWAISLLDLNMCRLKDGSSLFWLLVARKSDGDESVVGNLERS